MRHGRYQSYIVVSCIVVLLLSGCGVQEDTEEPPLERTPMPTFTPTPEGMPAESAIWVPTPQPDDPATPTPIPAEEIYVEPTPDPAAPPEETPTPTPEPEIEPEVVVLASVLNVRAGPGTQYPVVGQASAGDRFDVIGRTEDESWWFVCCLDGEEVWVTADPELTQLEEGTTAIPVITETPTAP